MIFYSFFTGAASAMSILQEEENGILSRLFTTPTAQSTILGGKFISILCLVTVQIIVLIIASSLIFGTEWGAPLPMAMAAAGLVVAAASFGVCITSFLKDTKQTGIVYGGVMTVMGMVGISSVFTASTPNVSGAAETLPLIVPQGWAMRAWQIAMGGGGVGDVLAPVAVLLALGAIFFLIAVYKFNKRFA